MYLWALVETFSPMFPKVIQHRYNIFCILIHQSLGSLYYTHLYHKLERLVFVALLPQGAGEEKLVRWPGMLRVL